MSQKPFSAARAQVIGQKLAEEMQRIANEEPTGLSEIFEGVSWFFANTMLVAADSAHPDSPIDVRRTTANACARATAYVRDHTLLRELSTEGPKN